MHSKQESSRDAFAMVVIFKSQRCELLMLSAIASMDNGGMLSRLFLHSYPVEILVDVDPKGLKGWDLSSKRH